MSSFKYVLNDYQLGKLAFDIWSILTEANSVVDIHAFPNLKVNYLNKAGYVSSVLPPTKVQIKQVMAYMLTENFAVWDGKKSHLKCYIRGEVVPETPSFRDLVSKTG